MFILNVLAGLVLTVSGATYQCAPDEELTYLIIQASNVTVTDCRVRGSPTGTNTVSVYGNSNVLRRLTVERSGATGVYFFQGTNHILDSSVIRDPVTRQGLDSWGIYSAANGLVTIRNTTVLGSGFSMHAPRGVVRLEGNTFKIPEEYRTDCNGSIMRDGPCQCGEFGVAIKATAGVTMVGNTFQGYKQSDRVCGGSGTPGSAVAVSACGPAELSTCTMGPIVIESNRILDSHNGIYTAPPVRQVEITGNCISGNEYGISDGFGSPSTIKYNILWNLNNIHLYGSRTGEISNNVIRECR